MANPKSKNILFQSGQDVDDMEIIEKYGLSRDLAFTPNINKAMFNAMEEHNYNGYIKQGMSDTKARTKAAQMKSKAMKAARDNGLKI